MTKEKYLELKSKYFDGVVYNNAIEYEPIGFFTASGDPISELDNDPDVERCDYDASGQVFYRVFAPIGMSYEEVWP